MASSSSKPPRAPDSSVERGRRGERLAADFLEARGYRIVARNVHARVGEIDLIALRRGTLCFVEVRLRSSAAFGSPAESVTPRKRQRIVRAARSILASQQLPGHRAVRFDVIGIDASSQPPRITHIESAFDA